MIDIQKHCKRPHRDQTVVIRAATINELSEYEEDKLAGIEENAQVNKIESIRVNDRILPIDPATKEARLTLGNLAFTSKVAPKDISSNELFFITCELDESELLNN